MLTRTGESQRQLSDKWWRSHCFPLCVISLGAVSNIAAVLRHRGSAHPSPKEEKLG